MLDNLPTGWVQTTLGEVCLSKGEYGANVSKSEFDPDMPRYVRITDIAEDGSLISENPVSISPSNANGYMLSSGDLLFARSGATVGKTLLYDPSYGPCAFAGYLIRFRPNLDVIDPYFARVSAQSDSYWAWVETVNRAQAQPNINAREFAALPLALPPLDEQRRIGEVLRSLDVAIALDGECIANLISVRDALLEKHFHRADWEPERPLPAGWTLTLLDDVVTRGSGHTPNKKISAYWGGEIRWVSLQDTKRLDKLYIHDTAERITLEGIANSSAVLHPKGTVVLSRDATVGRSAVTSSEMAVSQHFMAYRCGPKINNLYLYYWLQRMKPIFERIGAGSTIKTIGLPFFKGLKVAFPPIDEQIAVAGEMAELDGLISVHQSIQARSRSLKAAVSDDLLSGRVRVPA